MSGDHKVDQALLKDITSGVQLNKIETQEKNALPSVIDISAEKTVKAIETFDASNLTHTETVEKSGWKEAFSHDKATAELSKFDKTQLKHAETAEKNPLPNADDISAEKTVKAIETFDASNLTHTETVEKSGWKEAFSHDKATAELSKFDKTQLKHAETAEKNPLPNADVISQEKQERELRHSIGTHDRSSLKKVTSVEKDALKELVALEATHCAIEKFNKDQLKHAKIEEKNLLPTVDDINTEKIAQ